MTAQAQPIALPSPALLLAPELELVLLRFRVRAQRRAVWQRRVWSDDVDLLDTDAPTAEAEWIASSAEAGPLNEQIAAVEDTLQSHTGSRLFLLGEIFDLSSQEFDLLQACLAMALDPALARVCGMLHGDASRTYATEDLVARIYGHGRCAEWNPESPLVRWHLVTRRDVGPGDSGAVTIDPGIREWLRGRNYLDAALEPVAGLHIPCTPLESWPVECVVNSVKPQLNGEGRRAVRVHIVGKLGSGRRTFAAAICARLGMTLLAIHADEIEDAGWRSAFLHAQRHAFLHTCALAWTGDSMTRRLWPAQIPPFPLQFLITEGNAEFPYAEVGEIRIELPPARMEDRLAAWRRFAPREWGDEQLTELARSYRVQIGDIARACSAAPADVREAGLRVREASRASLGSLVQLLPCTFGWQDLVLPDSVLDALRDLVFEAQHRNEFWEQDEAQRLFPQGRGLLALFNGPPGTGKTMSAQVIAGALNYDLLRIDLSAVVSKYVGETSQNLGRILSRAAHMDAVLLFDEADGLFGKRAIEVRDAQDKFANTESAYLLQAIEAYPGIALLASNQKGSIDTAFLRRIRFLVEFAKPDEAQRLEIWKHITSALAGTKRASALEWGLKKLAQNVETTGAQIKSSVLGAIFVARRAEAELGMPHLLRGLERELAKEGRSLSAKERERLRADG